MEHKVIRRNRLFRTTEHELIAQIKLERELLAAIYDQIAVGTKSNIICGMGRTLSADMGTRKIRIRLMRK